MTVKLFGLIVIRAVVRSQMFTRSDIITRKTGKAEKRYSSTEDKR